MKSSKIAKISSIIGLSLFLAVSIFYQPVTVKGETAEQSEEIIELNRQIKEKREKAEDIQRRQELYNKQLENLQSQKMDLTNQISLLDNKIAKAELDIESTELDVDRTNLEIDKNNLDIEEKEKMIEKEREHVGVVLRLLYKQDNASALEILLLNDSFSEFMNQVKYLEDMNGEIGDSLKKLEKLKTDLEKEKLALDEKQKSLLKFKEELDSKKIALGTEKESKGNILLQTNESEQQYQSLVALAKQEQAQAAADIVSLEKLIRQKLSKQQNIKLEENSTGLSWPVTKNVVTTYFHDPEYPFRYIFEHPAIDIRAAQGSTIRASESGYVARAKDAGLGYSYIMIVHADGLATVYGHVSKIYVKEDEYVTQGQAIGLSGGTPGTPGAGRLTTGAHLHFEVRLNGIPVDPLNYLQ
ncbi:MAG: Peptidase M23B [Parcubacteria group bacterium GW2011_GWE2_39_37]|nr:MAG: Peptidase M23B [Parcubacteria group bacterium GW2011_GWE2_39_37]